MTTKRVYLIKSDEAANNQEESLLLYDKEDHIDFYHRNPNQEQIIDLLINLCESSAEHHRNTATKEDIHKESTLIIESLSAQNKELQDAVYELNQHLDRFSVKNILSIISLICVAISTVVLLIVFFSGPVVLRTPFIQFFLIISVGIFLMSKRLPGGVEWKL